LGDAPLRGSREPGTGPVWRLPDRRRPHRPGPRLWRRLAVLRHVGRRSREAVMARLDGKVALISGGARGQGAVAGRRFAAEGARVVLGDVLDDDGKAVAADLGEAGHYVHLDVTDEHDWRTAVDETEARFGKLDVLLNNAGILRFGSIRDTSLDDYLTVVRVNQVGVFLGMKYAVPAMERAGGGSIVNV